MTKINKTDIENINLLKKELKIKGVQTVKIKKGNYEIEISSSENVDNQKIRNISLQKENLIKNTA